MWLLSVTLPFTATRSARTLFYVVLLSCIECMRCRLLLPMIAMSVRKSVCLSRGSTCFHCAKTAERIKMLFGVNTPGPRRALCRMAVWFPCRKRTGNLTLNFGTAWQTDTAHVGNNSLHLMMHSMQPRNLFITKSRESRSDSFKGHASKP